MTWDQRRQNASFRGVAFELEDISGRPGGPEFQLFKYAESKKFFPQYTGHDSAQFECNCYVCGENADQDYQRLEAALLNQQPGTLIHPERGTMRVVATNLMERYESVKGGIKFFSVTFILWSRRELPGQTQNAASLVEDQNDTIRTRLKQTFSSSFTVTQVPDFVADAAQQHAQQLPTSLQAVAQQMGGAASGFQRQLRGFTTNLLPLLSNPASFADQAINLILQASNLSPDALTAYRAVRTLMAFGSTLKQIPLLTINRQRQARNRQALNNLVLVTGVGELARLTTQLTWPSVQEATAHRDELGAYLTQQRIALADSGDDLNARNLAALRANVVADIAARAADLQRLTQLSVRVPTPGLVLSYRLYDTPDREEEILRRNRVRHPGFIGPTDLTVLTS